MYGGQLGEQEVPVLPQWLKDRPEIWNACHGPQWLTVLDFNSGTGNFNRSFLGKKCKYKITLLLISCLSKKLFMHCETADGPEKATEVYKSCNYDMHDEK